MNQVTIAFIGAGNLTRALVSGLVSHQYDPKKIWASDPSSEKLAGLRQQFGIHTTTDNLNAVQQSDVVVLAVKPVHIQALCEEIKPAILQRQPLVISVALGATLALFARWLGADAAVVRAMPNTPAMVQAGMTGLYAGAMVSAEQKNFAEEIFRAVGTTLWVASEDEIDAVSVISGCGPGYVFLLMEAVERAAAQQGLNVATARLLTAETFLGAARLAMESDLPLADLRREVTSPGGATEKAVELLESRGIRQIIAAAVAAARQRCSEVAAQF